MITLGHLRVTLGHLWVTLDNLFLHISNHKANTTELHPKVRKTCSICLHSKSEKGLVHDAISKDDSLLEVTPGLARLEAAAWAHSAVSVVH